MLSDIALYLIAIDVLATLDSYAKLFLWISIGLIFLVLLCYLISYITNFDDKSNIDKCNVDIDKDLTDTEFKRLCKVLKYFVICVVSCLVLTIIIPSEKVMYSAIALNAVDKAVIENKDVQELLGKSFEVLNLKLDEVLKDKSE